MISKQALGKTLWGMANILYDKVDDYKSYILPLLFYSRFKYPEQKETIKNIIAAFKLETGQPIIFDSNIVRLVQKINFVDSNFEYGLTAQ